MERRGSVDVMRCVRQGERCSSTLSPQQGGNGMTVVSAATTRPSQLHPESSALDTRMLLYHGT